jgi:hypothetical protein
MDELTSSRERTVAVSERVDIDGTPELFLTIENTVEDRLYAYVRLLRTKQVLCKARDDH